MPPTDNESHQQVYLVRFVAMQETDEAGVYQTNSQESLSTRYSNIIKSSPVQLNGKKSENARVVQSWRLHFLLQYLLLICSKQEN